MAGVSAVFSESIGSMKEGEPSVCLFMAELCFCCSQVGFVAAVIESSLASNTLQHIFHAEEYLNFIGRFGTFLGLPTKFLIFALFFSAVQFIAVAFGTFSFSFNKLIAFLATLAASVGLLRRYFLLQARLNQRASRFAEDVKTRADLKRDE